MTREPAILIVEQNVLQTLQLADRAYGALRTAALTGEGRALLEDRHMREAYLGLV